MNSALLEPLFIIKKIPLNANAAYVLDKILEKRPIYDNYDYNPVLKRTETGEPFEDSDIVYEYIKHTGDETNTFTGVYLDVYINDYDYFYENQKTKTK